MLSMRPDRDAFFVPHTRYRSTTPAPERSRGSTSFGEGLQRVYNAFI